MVRPSVEGGVIKIVFCFNESFKCLEDEFSAFLLRKKSFFMFGGEAVARSDRPIKHKGYTLLISSVDILIPDVTKEVLEAAINRGVSAVLAPCYNASSEPSQVQTANPYITLEGFEREAREIWEREGFKLSPIKNGNKDVLFFRSEIAHGFPSYRAFIEELETLHVIKGWYVHKYGEGGFNSPREDILELVPSEVSMVLDVGAGGGGFGRALKKVLPHVKVFAVEPNETFASMCRGVYEKVFSTPFEGLTTDELFDLIVMGDVLEHMYNPWKALEKAKTMLKPGGFLILSVPVVDHWSIVEALKEGSFSYTPWGPLSFTHIRFFTEKSLLETLKFLGFRIEKVVRKELPPKDLSIRGSSTYAILIRARISGR